MTFLIEICITLVLALGMPSISATQKCSITTQDLNLVATLSKGNLKFALDMYKGLVNSNNLFFSPFSISVALAMVAVGAGGNTLTQMKDVLNLNDFSGENQINQAFLSVLDSTCSNSYYELSTANKLFIQDGFPILKPFLDTVTQFYKSSAENVDFKGNPEGVAAQISGWVEKQTNHHIKNIFPPNSLNVRMALVLVNAIYFRGTWETRFELSNTKSEDFTLFNGEKASVPMMNIEETFNYAKNDQLKCQILQLDYVGNRLVMYIILPQQKNGLAQLQQQLTPDAFNSLRQQLSSTLVKVKIPKFKLSFRRRIDNLLEVLGMADLFDQQSVDLKRIAVKNLHVSAVVHQAFVDVDENGTTAAAATGVEMLSYRMLLPPPIVSFIADHPFLFVIYDTTTNLILFMGNCDDPNV